MIFLHGSYDPHPEGRRLTPVPGMSAAWEAIPFVQVLERYRPDWGIPHAEAIFLCEDPDHLDPSRAAVDHAAECMQDALAELASRARDLRLETGLRSEPGWHSPLNLHEVHSRRCPSCLKRTNESAVKTDGRREKSVLIFRELIDHRAKK